MVNRANFANEILKDTVTATNTKSPYKRHAKPRQGTWSFGKTIRY